MSQKDRLLSHLQSGKSITRLDSWERLGIIETPARICELRDAGHHILTEMREVTNRYGEKVRIAVWSMQTKKASEDA